MSAIGNYEVLEITVGPFEYVSGNNRRNGEIVAPAGKKFLGANADTDGNRPVVHVSEGGTKLAWSFSPYARSTPTSMDIWATAAEMGC